MKESNQYLSYEIIKRKEVIGTFAAVVYTLAVACVVVFGAVVYTLAIACVVVFGAVVYTLAIACVVVLGVVVYIDHMILFLLPNYYPPPSYVNIIVSPIFSLLYVVENSPCAKNTKL